MHVCVFEMGRKCLTEVSRRVFLLLSPGDTWFKEDEEDWQLDLEEGGPTRPKLSGPELTARMTVETRIVRGSDWKWGNQVGVVRWRRVVIVEDAVMLLGYMVYVTELAPYFISLCNGK